MGLKRERKREQRLVHPNSLANLKRGKGIGGRPKGVQNRATVEVQQLAQRIVNDQNYLASLRRRLLDGTAGAMEVRLWEYAFGRPKETHEISGPEGRPILSGVLVVPAVAVEEWSGAARAQQDQLSSDATD